MTFSNFPVAYSIDSKLTLNTFKDINNSSMQKMNWLVSYQPYPRHLLVPLILCNGKAPLVN